MSGVKILHFLKDWWKFSPIHQYYTIALNWHVVDVTRKALCLLTNLYEAR